MKVFECILVFVVFVLLMGIASAESTSYVYANGQRVAKINESGVFYTHSDNLGSTSVVTNSKGEIVEEQVNLPFGEQISGGERYGFTGKEHDETGLQYFGARYYDSATGRFWKPDPAKDGLNWFAYANNNPLKFIDPDGRKFVLIGFPLTDEEIKYHQEYYVEESTDEWIVEVKKANERFKEDFSKTLKYIYENAPQQIVNKIKNLETMDREIKIQYGAGQFNPYSQTLYWDPELAHSWNKPKNEGDFLKRFILGYSNEDLNTNEEGRFSPATMLVHELGHAINSNENPVLSLLLEFLRVPFWNWRNFEEFKTTIKYEYPTVEAFGEDKRPSYIMPAFNEYLVSNPWSTTSSNEKSRYESIWWTNKFKITIIPIEFEPIKIPKEYIPKMN